MPKVAENQEGRRNFAEESQDARITQDSYRLSPQAPLGLFDESGVLSVL